MVFTFSSPSVFVANLKAALRAASVDPARVHLNVVRVELDAVARRARFVATNDHWLWINECPVDEIVGVDAKGTKVFGTARAEILISYADVKKIIKSVNTTKKASSWAVDLDPSGTVRQLSSEVTFKPVDATFPPYAQVLPSTVGGDRIVATFDAALMLGVCASFAEVGSKLSSRALRALSAFSDVVDVTWNGLLRQNGVGRDTSRND